MPSTKKLIQKTNLNPSQTSKSRLRIQLGIQSISFTFVHNCNFSMKNTLRKLFKKLGLLNWAQNIVRNRQLAKKKDLLKKYEDVELWQMNYRGMELSYSVSDFYSKGWFYPRYDNGKIHEPLATDVFIEHVKDNSRVLDIGGHLGYFSCIAGKLAKNGEVHVFEVDPKCIGLISNNLNINDLTNVKIHNQAVSDAKGMVKIPVDHNPNPGLIINSKSYNDFIEVEAISIDDFLIQNNLQPDFIKIDIEGAEGIAIAGMKRTLAKSNVTLLVEIHVDILKNQFDTDYKDIIGLLLENGYTLVEIEHRNSDGKNRYVDLKTDLEGNTMILCEKRSDSEIQ